MSLVSEGVARANSITISFCCSRGCFAWVFFPISEDVSICFRGEKVPNLKFRNAKTLLRDFSNDVFKV